MKLRLFHVRNKLSKSRQYIEGSDLADAFTREGLHPDFWECIDPLPPIEEKPRGKSKGDAGTSDS